MPQLHTYKIFISHAWRYDDDYNGIVGLLNNANNFSWANYSVPHHDPVYARNREKLEELLVNQMKFAEAFVVPAGMYLHYSDWIQFELNYGSSKDKPIIGVYPWGSERAPQALQDVAAEMVGWSSNSITSAIRRQVYG